MQRHSGKEAEGSNRGAQTQHMIGEMGISPEKLDLKQAGAYEIGEEHKQEC